MRRAFGTLAGLAAAAAALAPAASAGPGTTVAIQAPASAPAGAEVGVSGAVLYGTDVFVATEDPSGDAFGGLGALGTDIVRATIASDPAKPAELVFTIELASLPPPLGGTPDVIMYEWDVEVDGNVPGARPNYGGPQWRRTNISGAAFGGSTSTNPWIRLISCDASACDYVRPLPGAFDAAGARVTATVLLSAIEGQPGSVIAPGSPASGANIRSSLITGVFASWWVGGDDAPQTEEYVVPARAGSVTLAVVPAGAADPEEFTATATPDGAGASGGFSARAHRGARARRPRGRGPGLLGLELRDGSRPDHADLRRRT